MKINQHSLLNLIFFIILSLISPLSLAADPIGGGGIPGGGGGTPVPEPSTLILLGFGGLVFLMQKLKR